MISYKLISLLVIVILFALLYKLNIDTKRESFDDHTECRDVNEDYCRAFNSSSPECTPGSNTDVSSDCRQTCGLCDIESSTVTPNNYVSPLNVLSENNDQNSNNLENSNRNVINNVSINDNLTNTRYLNRVTPNNVNIINNNMPNNTSLSNTLQQSNQIVSEESNIPMNNNNNDTDIYSEQNIQMNNNNNDTDIYSEQNIPIPSNSINKYNSYNVSQESEIVNEEIDRIREISYKFNVDESLVNDFKSSDIKKQFSEKFNIPIEIIDSVTVSKGSVVVTIKFKNPVLLDVFDDFSVNIKGVSYKGSANFDENSGNIKPYENGYSGVNNINTNNINKQNNTINNLINMAQNSNMNDIQNYLNNFSLSDLFYILKQLLSLNINQNGIADLIEVINGIISSKNTNTVNNLNNNLNNLNNNSVINNSPNMNTSGKQYSNGPITQKHIKGVGNVFAPRIIISDDQNNI